MKNKTRGECKHFSCSDEGQCMDNEWTFRDSDACDKFQSKVITNGDVIRQMSNKNLAIFWAIGCIALLARPREYLVLISQRMFAIRSGLHGSTLRQIV